MRPSPYDNFKYWSLQLGRCYTYLAVYRKQHNLQHLTPKELYYYVKEKEQRMFEIRDELQAIYYELQEKRKISQFGDFLKKLNIFTHKYTISSTFINSFNIPEYIVPSKIEKYETIIKEYKNFKDMKCITQ